MANYERRSEWPKSKLDDTEWKARLDSVTQWITTPPDKQRLRVGAIWGPRGTGKSSFLRALYRQLEPSEDAERVKNAKAMLYLACRDPQSKKKKKQPVLFTPDLIDDSNGDHLFTHFLAFLANHYPGLQAQLKRPQNALTVHRYHDDFKNFELETAVSQKSLHELLSKRLATRSTFSLDLRNELQKALATDEGWYVVLVDDLDLVPHRGPEFLRLLHLYLRDLPFVVLITGDRQQLIEHTIIDNKNRYQHEDRELALQLLAKLVPYELTVPYLTPADRVEGFLGEPDDRLGKELTIEFDSAVTLLMDGWREWSRKEAERNADDDDNNRGNIRADEKEAPKWVKNPSHLLGRLLSPRWRAIHRTYNRLITYRDLGLHSEKDQTTDLGKHSGKRGSQTADTSFSSPLRSLGIPPELESFTYTALLAVDEHYPTLNLWEPFIQDPEGLLAELNVLKELPASNVQASDMDAPLDCLFSRMEGRERHAARRALQEIRLFVDIVRHIKITKQLISVLALSASPSERSASDELKGLSRTAQVVDIDLRRFLDGKHPGADVIKMMIGRLQHEALPHTDTVYLRAPLSLAAWLGWYTRKRPQPPTTALGPFGMEVLWFNLVPNQLKRLLSEPFVLEPPSEARFEHSDTASPLLDEAMIVVDVRQHPDASSRALPLLKDSKQVIPQQAYKLTSHKGFILTENNFHDVLSDILWMFDELRGDGIKRVHVALATPAPLAFFIGQQLHAFAPVELYEYAPEHPAYHHVATLA